MLEKFKLSKYISFIFVLLLSLVVAVFVYLKSDLIRHKVEDIYSILQSYISYSTEKIANLKNRYEDHIRSVDKLRMLKTENERIIHKFNEQSFIESQNRELKKMLKFSKTVPSLIVSTRIISKSIDDFIGNMMIAAGEISDVKPGMSVVSELGVIGRVSYVGKNFSDVILITDPNSRIVGFNPISKNKMIIYGLGNKKLQADFVEEEHQMEIGQVIYTTGEGGYFPEGMAIGKIISVDAGLILLEPMFDLRNLHYVQVIGNQISREG